MSVRACTTFFFCEPYRKRRKERVKCEVGKNTEEKGLCREHTKTFSCLLVRLLFFLLFFSFFFLLSFSFPFSIFSFPPIGCQCPMPKRQTKDKRHKIKRRKENSTAKIRKIISYNEDRGLDTEFQRDDTTIRKDVRITQWPRKTPH